MGLAENQQVSFDLLEDYLEQHPEASNWGNGISSFRENALFQDYHGLKTFRKAMASFMEQIRGGKAKFDPDRIVLTAGATAANELLTFILADPGDALLIPTPYYPGFEMENRREHRSNPMRQFKRIPSHSQSLRSRLRQGRSGGDESQRVLLTNPSNPLGTAVARAVLEDILDFAARKDIHLISDEIYSGSVFASPEFVSVAEIVEARATATARGFTLSTASPRT
uniref:Aminotransferase class I/classII large domain-containing protein n=1 Tax=Ananas comosus var. bracteatus TaxID=296719 RepID=A0A6V7QJ32_ANACO|nr:unnamed protein product [Ananas comosus var. bracteatus]